MSKVHGCSKYSVIVGRRRRRTCIKEPEKMERFCFVISVKGSLLLILGGIVIPVSVLFRYLIVLHQLL